jgi:Na+/melibiose symporter-like transporter
MNRYFWELSSSGNLAFFTAYPLGIMLGAFVARRLNQIFDKKPSVMMGTAWWAFCQILPVVLRLLDWFPENGTDSLLMALVCLKFVQGVGVVQALITFSSMVADVVDEHELKTGKRQEGIFFAAVSFSGKFSTGVGNMVGGIALDLISWPRGAEIRTAADVPIETIVWLGLVYGPIVSGFAVVCLWCFSKYELDRQRHAEVVEALGPRRRERAGSEGSGRVSGS